MRTPSRQPPGWGPRPHHLQFAEAEARRTKTSGRASRSRRRRTRPAPARPLRRSTSASLRRVDVADQHQQQLDHFDVALRLKTTPGENLARIDAGFRAAEQGAVQSVAAHPGIAAPRGRRIEQFDGKGQPGSVAGELVQHGPLVRCESQVQRTAAGSRAMPDASASSVQRSRLRSARGSRSAG